MEELISRYFFVAIVIFATILDLVGRWHKNRRRGAGRTDGVGRHELRMREESREREEADMAHDARMRGALAEIEWERRQLEALEQQEREEEQQRSRPEPTKQPVRAVDLPDLAKLFLEEAAPPIPWMEIRRPATVPPKPVVERPKARVVPAPRPAGARSAVPALRPPTPSRVRRRLRALLEDPAAARRAIVLAEVLGPCRGIEPYSQRR